MTAERRAAWCLATGQPWDLWDRLTRLEREAFLTVLENARR